MLRMGLSPRLRGNLYSCHLLQHHAGSIPAPAGEPINSIAVFNAHQVYPRACGGTVSSSVSPATKSGLSPRLRGNPGHGRPYPHAERSMPAPAGEPRSPVRWTRQGGVYARACGGTSVARRITRGAVGLSPRLRGNRLIAGLLHPIERSIPAPAGEPFQGAVGLAQRWVYPRACGGTP